MALRVKPTPTRPPANSLSAPMDDTALHSILSLCHPLGSRCDPKTAGSVGVQTAAHPGRYDCLSRTKPLMLPSQCHKELTTMWTLFIRSLNLE